MAHKPIHIVNIEELAEVLSDTDIKESKDLGSALLHSGIHVVHGAILIVTAVTDASAYVVF